MAPPSSITLGQERALIDLDWRWARAMPDHPNAPVALMLMNGSFAGYSGGDLHAALAVREWSASLNVEVLMPHDSSPDLMRLFGLRMVRMAPRLSFDYAWLLRRYVERMAGAAEFIFRRRHRWDVAVAASHFPFDVLPLLAARGRVIRGTYWHHHVSGRSQRPLWLHVVVRLAEEATAQIVRQAGIRVLTSSEATRAFLIRRGVPSGQIAVTDQGSEAAHRTGEAPVATLGERRFVLFCARQSRLKGAHLLPRVVEAVLEHGSDCCVVICGSRGDQTERLERLHALHLDSGRVYHLGFVPDAAKQWLLDRAHVVLAPSEEDGWGYLVGEALQAGCCVVAWDIPAVRKAHPAGPVYVPLGDVEALLTEVLCALDGPRRGSSTTTGRRSWKEVAMSDLRHLLAVRAIGNNESEPVAVPWIHPGTTDSDG